MKEENFEKASILLEEMKHYEKINLLTNASDCKFSIVVSSNINDSGIEVRLTLDEIFVEDAHLISMIKRLINEKYIRIRQELEKL